MQNELNKMDIYVIKTRFDISILHKLKWTKRHPLWSPTLKAKQAYSIYPSFKYIFKGLEKFTLRYQGFPGGSVVKNQPAKAGHQEGDGFDPELGRSPGEATRSRILNWKRSLSGKSHGQRSLVLHSPWGRIESDTRQWFNNKQHAHV